MMKKAQYRPSMGELNAELKRLRRKRARRGWYVSLLAALTLAVLAGGYLSSTYFMLMRVNSGSMENTLREGDVVLCQKNAQIMRGDIVVFERAGTLLIKRVIAMEGDQVRVGFDGKVSINGVAIEEAYVSGGGPGGDTVYPITVPAGQVFVMGDHRATSVDSRHTSVGLVSLREIIGGVKALIWPFTRIRGI